MVIFLPVKPVFAERILQGEKLWEYRRVSVRDEVTHAIIYSSSPEKKIVAVAKVSSILRGSMTSIWNKTKKEAGISRRVFREYFEGVNQAFALGLQGVRPLEDCICPKSLRDGFVVPQSFRYVDQAFFEKIHVASS